jgi:tight adherence protein B
MDTVELISMAIGVAVIVLVAGAGFVFSKSPGSEAEQRLQDLTGKAPGKIDAVAGLLLRPPALDLAGSDFWSRWIPNPESLGKLYEQADVPFSFQRFMVVVGLLTVTGTALGAVFKVPLLLVPACGAGLGALPFMWLVHRKNRRIKRFIDAMPQAVELIGRALRAGHGLASGMHLVAEEMKGPIADEFGRVFEEQNLGVPIELALRGMADRIPVMDVRFFVIAVIVQRSTGGDLAEVLDKIGKLIRQRFELQGHVRSLTAEGRLSGIVLLALPPGLLAFLCMSNYEYISVLFTTPVGTKMLMITAGLQVVGALSIKKIVAIKV